IHELQNSNAQLIEDHTRDVLSIKAKETQLVRARSDAEAAESQVERLGRELERVRKEVRRMEEEGSQSQIYRDRAGRSDVNGDNGERPPSATSGPRANSSASLSDSNRRTGRSYISSPSEEKENGIVDAGSEGGKPVSKNRSPVRATGSAAAVRREVSGDGGGGGESWKRAAEVTSQLKARIELMKVCFCSVVGV
ncbi:MAG: hypothetical protein Q9201_003732, partial [Fulgogasparrea decipioides]